MFGLKLADETTERITRRIHGAGLRVAGERGGAVANKVTNALRLGRIELCDDAECANCH